MISKIRRLLLMTVCFCLGAAASLPGAQEFSIGNYQLVSSKRVSVTQVQATYSASITNNTPIAWSSVTAILIPVYIGALPILGQDALVFESVSPGAQSTSLNTFTVIVDRQMTVDFGRLLWVYTSPGLVPTHITVGKDREVSAGMPLKTQALRGGQTVTLVSSDPSKVLLSTDPALMGSVMITLIVPEGSSQTPNFWVQGVASDGTATITGSSPGYPPAYFFGGAIVVRLVP